MISVGDVDISTIYKLDKIFDFEIVSLFTMNDLLTSEMLNHLISLTEARDIPV